MFLLNFLPMEINNKILYEHGGLQTKSAIVIKEHFSQKKGETQEWLEEYFGKKLGGYLLSEAIKNSFNQGAKRVWVHTCSLDHENALKNYLARGMKVFKTETLIR